MVTQFADSDIQELYDSFLVETGEILDSLTNDLMTLEHQPKDFDLLNRIFRGFHTIKGTSSFMGFEEIATITHHAEDILNKLRRDELNVSQPIIDVLLEVHDIISLLVERIKNGEIQDYDYSSIIDKIELLKDPNQSSKTFNSDTESKPTSSKALSSSDSAVDKVLNNPDLFNEQGDFTDEELLLIQAAFDEVNKNFNNDISKSTQSESTIKKTQEHPSGDDDDKKDDSSSHAEHKQIVGKAPKSSSETIRIDVSRIETLMDLSGELVLGRNRLSQISSLLNSIEISDKDKYRDLLETASQIDFITSEIQSAVMKMRMVPIAKLYQKAPRIVRDLSKEFNKNIDLVLMGEETEIDRGIIEELNDPLVHMIRNSCDHGIEKPEDRIKEGKPAQGTITINAYQEGNAIVLKIEDDGKGMDPEALKAKAIEKGVISEDQAASMTQKEALQLIFAPGFSTAQKVTSVSGRGVGMDVVKTNIQNLKGMIEIESVKGKGSTFIIKLPLTLAIIQGLIVKVDNEEYAIPLSSVVEVVSIDSSSIYTINGQEVIKIRDEVNPLLRLDSALSCRNINPELKNRYVVLVGYGIKKIGLVVDELLGQQEIVIKSLGEYLGHIHGIAGSTILGDGRVIMIVEVSELIREAISFH
jgi:two-component system chemotaxis sensor kinase CheA